MSHLQFVLATCISIVASAILLVLFKNSMNPKTQSTLKAIMFGSGALLNFSWLYVDQPSVITAAGGVIFSYLAVKEFRKLTK
jgi:hypothetical protein